MKHIKNKYVFQYIPCINNILAPPSRGIKIEQSDATDKRCELNKVSLSRSRSGRYINPKNICLVQNQWQSPRYISCQLITMGVPGSRNPLTTSW